MTKPSLSLLAALVIGCAGELPPSPAPAVEVAMAPAEPVAVAPAKPPSADRPSELAAPPPDAIKTPSGIASKVLSAGTGQVHPRPRDTVKVHYSGWTTDGRMFDSSLSRGEPAIFKLDQVIKGWTEGVGLMVAGEKRRLWMPAELCYGHTPRGGAPAGDLVFDIELLEVIPAIEVPVPEDVGGPPRGARKTRSGIAYRVLRKGTGTRAPTATDTVVVSYSGWTTDGRMFDSSVTRGTRARFPLKALIKGWSESVQLMRVGDVTRFWIPAHLAYGDNPRNGAPAGMLVFDIELHEIE